jgi:sarcosine oxidase subunit gamma
MSSQTQTNSKAVFDDVTWESPLVEAVAAYQGNATEEAAGVILQELPFSTYLNIRGDAEDSKFLTAVKKACGVEVPTKPNTYNYDEKTGHVISWLSPDEWLLIAPRESVAKLEAALRKGFGDLHAAVTDNSHGYTAITINGKNARELLAKGTPVDVSVEHFTTGDCAQSLLAKTNVLMWAETDSQLGVVVRRSFADYLWQWLIHSAQDFGVHVR